MRDDLLKEDNTQDDLAKKTEDFYGDIADGLDIQKGGAPHADRLRKRAKEEADFHRDRGKTLREDAELLGDFDD